MAKNESKNANAKGEARKDTEKTQANAENQQAQEKTEAQREKERAAAEQDEARNKEALGEREPGTDAKATVPVNAGANFGNTLEEAEGRGFIGGQPFEERFAEEERARRIRAGLLLEG